MAKMTDETPVDALETEAKFHIEDDGSETRVYELGFHLEPELAQEEVKKAYQALRDAVSANGTVVAEGEPLKIPLAYTISRMETTGRRDFDSAYFAWIAYEANVAGHTAVNEAATEEKRIVRMLDLVTTKEEAAHSAEMHELFSQNPQEALALEDDTLDTELDAALSKEAAA